MHLGSKIAAGRSESTSRICYAWPRTSSTSRSMSLSPLAAAAFPNRREEVIWCSGVSDVVECGRYRGILLDQFGVLHDGRKGFPAAIEAVASLHAAGYKLFVISNSSRRAAFTLEKLASLGFSPSHFVGAVTSGELAHECLTKRHLAWAASLPQNPSVIHMTWAARGAVSLPPGFAAVEDPALADCVICHGTEALGSAVRDAPPVELGIHGLLSLLPARARANLPMV